MKFHVSSTPPCSRNRFFRNSRTAHRENGFSALELIVVIAVMSVLLALLVPAVMSGREASRKIQCVSNLRQLSIATESFVASRGRYPAFPAYDSNFHGQMRSDSVHAQLLPYLDQQALHDQIVPELVEAMGEPPQSDKNRSLLGASLPVFICPSDSVPVGGNSYRTNYGTTTGTHSTWKWGQPLPGPVEEESVWGGFRGISKPGNVLDGLSNSVFFSERIVGDGDPLKYSPVKDVTRSGGHSFRPADAVANCKLISTGDGHASFLGWSWLPKGYAQTAYNHVLTPNSRIPDCFDGWNSFGMGQGAMTARSYHFGGVNVVMGDSSSRFISDGIDLIVWRAIGTNYGGEVIDDF